MKKYFVYYLKEGSFENGSGDTEIIEVADIISLKSKILSRLEGNKYLDVFFAREDKMGYLDMLSIAWHSEEDIHKYTGLRNTCGDIPFALLDEEKPKRR